MKKSKLILKYVLIILGLVILVSSGIFGYQYWYLPKKKVTIPTTIKNETINWKNYRNEKYGFELKYPQKWYLKEYPNCFFPMEDNCMEEVMIQNMENIFTGNYGVNFYATDTSVFIIQIFNDNYSFIEEYIEKWIKEHDGSQNLNKIITNEVKTVKIGEEQHKLWWKKYSNEENINFIRNGKRYRISYFSVSINDSASIDLYNQNKEIFDQILSNFKFIR